MAVLTGPELLSLLRDAGWSGDDLLTMAAIAYRESRWNPQAHNDNPKTGDDSYGLFQINMIGSLAPSRRRAFGIVYDAELLDPVVNVRAARVLWAWGLEARGSGTYHWVEYRNARIPESAWAAARAAVAETEAIVTEVTYAFGYNGKRKTLAQLNDYRPWRLEHPEIRRRHIAMYDAARADGIDLGMGGAGRTRAQQEAAYARDPSRFAKPGSSYHEVSYVDENGKEWACAIDNTPTPAFGWLTKNCERFGLINFPDSKPVKEPWHTQPIELPRARRLYKPGKHMLTVWDLPDTPAPPIDPPTQPPTNDTEAIVNELPIIGRGSSGYHVKVVQSILAFCGFYSGMIDGQAGPLTEAGIVQFQKTHGLVVDGKVGRKQTWPKLLEVL